MIDGPIALAFTAGMIATFNPCGFSLLPAYIGAFVAGDQVDDRVQRRIWQAITVAAMVSIGFVVVFASVGFVIDSIAGEIRRQLPWVTIVIGGLLLVGGLAMVIGWKPSIALHGPRISTRGNAPTMMVGYGVTYAIASLSCTIGPFLAVTGTALGRSRFEGLASYVAYALGMGLIILILSIASAVAHGTIATRMRRLSRVAGRVGGGLMMIAGAYAIWYGRWELAVYDGDLGTDPVIEAGEDVRLWFVNTIESVGAERLGLFSILAVVAAVGFARHRDRLDRPAALSRTEETT